MRSSQKEFERSEIDIDVYWPTFDGSHEVPAVIRPFKKGVSLTIFLPDSTILESVKIDIVPREYYPFKISRFNLPDIAQGLKVSYVDRQTNIAHLEVLDIEADFRIYGKRKHLLVYDFQVVIGER